MAPSLIAFSLVPQPALAQGEGSPDEPASEASPELSGDELRVVQLRERAVAVFMEAGPGQDASLAIIAAWQEVADAAQAIAPDHLEYGRAMLKIASQLFVLGRNAEARSAVETGLAVLPDDLSALMVRGEGVALLGTILAQSGDAAAAVEPLLDNYERFLADYAQIPPDEIGRGEMMTKSNLEFSLSQVMLRIGRTDAALAYQLASLETREAFLGPNDPDTIGSYMGYASTLRRANRMDEAETYARIAVGRAVEYLDPSDPAYARALEMLGIVLSRTGRPIEATGYLSRALELKREHEGADSLFFGYGIHLLGTILHQRERYEDAVPLFEEAAPIFARFQGEESPFGRGSLAYAGQGEFALGRDASALARLRSLDEALGDGSTDLEITERIGPDLVRALIRAGEPEEAARIAARDLARLAAADAAGAFALYHARLIDSWAQAVLGQSPGLARRDARDTLRHLERAQSRSASGFLQVEERAALDLVMQIAIASGDDDLLAQALAVATRSGIAQATALRGERLAAETPEFAEALRALQNAEAELDTADRAYLRALARGDTLGPLQEALEAASGARDRALTEVREFATEDEVLGAPGEVTIASLREGLGAGEALLAIAPVYDGAYSLLVTPDHVVARRVAMPRAQFVDLAQRVRDGAAQVQFDAELAQELASAVFVPEAIEALEDITALRVVAGGELASLPFGILRLPEGAQATQGWLIDRFALVNAASLETTATKARQAVDGGSRGFVAFAAPTPFGDPAQDAPNAGAVASPAFYFERSGADASQLATLPALPQSEQEARIIAAEFGNADVKVFTGDDASERNLSDPSVARASVLLFATHGLVGGELEALAEPALVLARPDPASGDDGVLSASEIARLDLSADWVILTACDSAAGFSGGAPAFSGLVSAFRFAGGGSILATHWKVRDDVAAYVAIETLRHFRENGDKARALNHAIAQLRTQSGIPGADRPDIWGPFVLIE